MAPRKQISAINKNSNTHNIGKSPMKKRNVKKSPLTSGEMPPVGKIPSGPSSGVMFVKHLPNGFYEKEMKEFFGQFGAIKRVFLARSKRTSRSQGYGYIEFVYEEIAQIASSAVNNYLLFGRSIKATVVSKLFSKIPRNIMKALDSYAGSSAGYREWLRSNISDENGYVGTKRARSLLDRQKNKMERALTELKQSGVKIPEVHNCFVKLIDIAENDPDLQQQAEELSSRLEAKKINEKKVKVTKATSEANKGKKQGNTEKKVDKKSDSNGDSKKKKANQETIHAKPRRSNRGGLK